jgi:hypothetical protein
VRKYVLVKSEMYGVKKKTGEKYDAELVGRHPPDGVGYKEC